MKIALIGYGKMGKSHWGGRPSTQPSIGLKIDIDSQLLYPRKSIGLRCIEFTGPHSAKEPAEMHGRRHPIVAAAPAGWSTVRKWISVAGRRTAVFYASNFSVGVNIFLKSKKLARLMSRQGEL